MSFLEKYLFSFFAHFLVGLFVFLEWSLVSSRARDIKERINKWDFIEIKKKNF